jgi:hypothetical protein
MENTVAMRRETELENPVSAGLCKNLDLFAATASFFHGGKG